MYEAFKDSKGVEKMKVAQANLKTIEQLTSRLFSSIHNYIQDMLAAGISIEAFNYEILCFFARAIKKAEKRKLNRFPYSALVALRIVSRKIQKVRDSVYGHKNELEKLKIELQRALNAGSVPGDIASKLQELVKIAERALAARDIEKGLNTAGLIQKLFELGFEMDREGLMQVITVNRQHSSDIKVPERIDLITLKRLIICERLEDPEHAYLLDALK